jgi:hypothetical protein
VTGATLKGCIHCMIIYRVLYGIYTL